MEGRKVPHHRDLPGLGSQVRSQCVHADLVKLADATLKKHLRHGPLGRRVLRGVHRRGCRVLAKLDRDRQQLLRRLVQEEQTDGGSEVSFLLLNCLVDRKGTAFETLDAVQHVQVDDEKQLILDGLLNREPAQEVAQDLVRDRQVCGQRLADQLQQCWRNPLQHLLTQEPVLVPPIFRRNNTWKACRGHVEGAWRRCPLKNASSVQCTREVELTHDRLPDILRLIQFMFQNLDSELFGCAFLQRLLQHQTRQSLLFGAELRIDEMIDLLLCDGQDEILNLLSHILQLVGDRHTLPDPGDDQLKTIDLKVDRGWHDLVDWQNQLAPVIADCLHGLDHGLVNAGRFVLIPAGHYCTLVDAVPLRLRVCSQPRDVPDDGHALVLGAPEVQWEREVSPIAPLVEEVAYRELSRGRAIQTIHVLDQRQDCHRLEGTSIARIREADRLQKRRREDRHTLDPDILRDLVQLSSAVQTHELH
mmetsp:Transcript_109494/g.353424  ORF Transcript_109494/g.353424 Transcript_109494/m.353424 type:complete len:474 (-) Transcript_109494:535-1956(-)